MSDVHQKISSIDYRTVPSPGEIFASGKTGFYKPVMFICGQSGYPAGCAYTDKNNFAPRVGIAWSATPKTVVRAGAGMFYALNDLNPLFRLAAGLPGNIAQTLNSDNFIPRFRNFDVFGAAVVGRCRFNRQASTSSRGRTTPSSGTSRYSAHWQRTSWSKPVTWPPSV